MNRPVPKLNLALGGLTAALGLLFLLLGLGIVPLPAAPRENDAPLWLAATAGLVFFLGGAAVILLALGHGDEQGNLPPDAPRWLVALQYLMVFGIAAGIASIASWVAFGPGERAFSGGFPFFGAHANAMLGRALFGVGAALAWLMAAMIACAGIAKLFRRND